MPNWCSTRVIITHQDKDELKKFAGLIEKWTDKQNSRISDFEHNWLGNLVLNAEIGTVDAGKSTDISCRGMISDRYFVDDNTFIICTETAWNPKIQVFVKLLEKYLPDAQLFYNAEECGNDIYFTNDPDLLGSYVIDSWDCEDIESDSEADRETVIEQLQVLLLTKENNLEKLLKMLEDSEYADGIKIHEWQYVPVSELE